MTQPLVKKGRCARCLQTMEESNLRELEFNARQASWAKHRVCRWCVVKLVTELVQWLAHS